MTEKDVNAASRRSLGAIFMAVGLLSLLAAGIVIVVAMGRIDTAVDRLEQVGDRLIAAYSDSWDANVQATEAMQATRTELSRTIVLLEEQARDLGESQADAAMFLAWLTLRSGTSGDFGKSAALQYLSEQSASRVSFTGLDLSCPAPGTAPDVCFAPVKLERVYLENQALNDVDLRHTELSVMRFTGGHMSDIQLDYASLRDVAFIESRLSDFSARHARLQQVDITGGGGGITDFDLTDAIMRGGTWSDLIVYNSRFENGLLEYVTFDGVGFINVSFRGAGLSGTKFEDLGPLENVDFTNAWAWRDQAPEGLDLSLITLCDTPQGHRDWGSSPMRGLPRPDDCVRSE